MTQQRLFPTERMTHVTVRLECQLASGDTSVGTGFFFAFPRSKDRAVPVIVTNAHVVRGASTCKMTLSREIEGRRGLSDHMQLELSGGFGQWIAHPDPKVDLACCLVGPVVNMWRQRGTPVSYVHLYPAIIPTMEQKAEPGAVEDVLMVGYPNGLWDYVNNLPLVRAGKTATHPSFDYLGEKEFLIDAACYPGSSGSPVFIHNGTGSRVTRAGNFEMGNNPVLFMGVLRAGPMITATGEIRIIDVPTQQIPIAQVNLMMNLGIVIKSERILEFDSVLPPE